MIIGEQDFKQFADYIKANYGINFKQEKKTLVEGRLRSVLISMNISSLSEYLAYVKADKTGKAASVMLNRITTNHTFFMRERAHFDYFRDNILPLVFKSRQQKDLRIWSAACSTGEEPYTLAMIIADYFGSLKAERNTQILATDISQGVLDSAKKGIYPKEKMSDVPDVWKKRYFKDDKSGNYIVNEQIKKEVIFKNLNLMDKVFPFRRKMHVIFCRNVMIYFDNDTKDQLIEHLYDVTEPGGFLFIGHSESLNRSKSKYKYVMPAVYTKE